MGPGIPSLATEVYKLHIHVVLLVSMPAKTSCGGRSFQLRESILTYWYVVLQSPSVAKMLLSYTTKNQDKIDNLKI